MRVRVSSLLYKTDHYKKLCAGISNTALHLVPPKRDTANMAATAVINPMYADCYLRLIEVFTEYFGTFPLPPIDVDNKEDEEESPLNIACFNGQTEEVARLLSVGETPTSQTILLTCMVNKLDILKLLVKGPSPDLMSEEGHKKRLIHELVDMGCVMELEYLIGVGFLDVNMAVAPDVMAQAVLKLTQIRGLPGVEGFDKDTESSMMDVDFGDQDNDTTGSSSGSSNWERDYPQDLFLDQVLSEPEKASLGMYWDLRNAMAFSLSGPTTSIGSMFKPDPNVKGSQYVEMVMFMTSLLGGQAPV